MGVESHLYIPGVVETWNETNDKKNIFTIRRPAHAAEEQNSAHPDKKKS